MEERRVTTKKLSAEKAREIICLRINRPELMESRTYEELIELYSRHSRHLERLKAEEGVDLAEALEALAEHLTPGEWYLMLSPLTKENEQLAMEEIAMTPKLYGEASGFRISGNTFSLLIALRLGHPSVQSHWGPITSSEKAKYGNDPKIIARLKKIARGLDILDAGLEDEERLPLLGSLSEVEQRLATLRHNEEVGTLEWLRRARAKREAEGNRWTGIW